MISKLLLVTRESGTAVSHQLAGNSIAEVEFANKNKTVKNEVQLNSPTTEKKRCGVVFPSKYSFLLEHQIAL